MEQHQPTDKQPELYGHLYNVLGQRTVEKYVRTPAMARAVERRDREIEEFKTAEAELIRLWDMNWKKPMDLMYAVVDATEVSLGTVNLAYARVAKAKKRQALDTEWAANSTEVIDSGRGVRFYIEGEPRLHENTLGQAAIERADD